MEPVVCVPVPVNSAQSGKESAELTATLMRPDTFHVQDAAVPHTYLVAALDQLISEQEGSCDIHGSPSTNAHRSRRLDALLLVGAASATLIQSVEAIRARVFAGRAHPCRRHTIRHLPFASPRGVVGLLAIETDGHERSAGA
jgi:hypothetical protein